MSTDLTEVLERTIAPPMGIDPYAALHSGRRRRLRRRLTTVGATLAVVTAVGLAATLSQGDRGVPTPAATTLTPDMVTAPLDKELWTFDLKESDRVEFGRVLKGSNRVAVLASVRLVNGQAWFAPKDHPEVVLGVAPAGGDQPRDIFAGAYWSMSGSDGERLGDDLEVYVRHVDRPEAAAAFRGRVFTDAQGRLHGPGGLLTTAEFGRGTDGPAVTVWVDPLTLVYGRASALSSATGTLRADRLVADRDAWFRTAPSETVTAPGTTTVVEADDPGPEEGWVVGVAPGRITNLRMELEPGTTVLTPLEVKPLQGDHVAFAAEYRGTKGRTVTITLRWTNPDGSQGYRDV